MSKLKLATFRADITPPLGHPLCGGWYERRAEGITDPLFAIGIVLVSAEDAPVVLCALDWCEVSHADHLLWRARLAEAAGTQSERVAVHCIHSHEAPWPDRAAQALVERQDPGAKVMFQDFCDGAMQRVAQAVRGAMSRAQPLTHIGIGEAQVEKVASNRRILGADGKIKAVRWTATKDPAVRAEPEGLIDPMLKTVSFWNAETKLAALHFYATHPNSYGDLGLVTKDFAGLAREQLQAEEPRAVHIYLTGCAGNITAGKYNDGAHENRPALAQRLYAGMLESERRAERLPIGRFGWRTLPVNFPPREDLAEAPLLNEIGDLSQPRSRRINAAMRLAYLRQTIQREPTLLTCLELGRVRILHLPGEPFIEYQLYSQAQAPGLFVLAVGYGDCSTGYVTMAHSFAEGGYEPKDAFVSGQAEALMKDAIRKLLG